MRLALALFRQPVSYTFVSPKPLLARRAVQNQLNSCQFSDDFWQLLTIISRVFRITTIYIFCKTSPILVSSQSQNRPRIVPDFRVFSSETRPKLVLSSSQECPKKVLFFGNFFIVGRFLSLKTRLKTVQNQNGLFWQDLDRAKNRGA